MIMTRRLLKPRHRQARRGGDDDDEMLRKRRSRSYSLLKMIGLLSLVPLVLVFAYVQQKGEMSLLKTEAGTTVSKLGSGGKSNTAGYYELYPFLVDSDMVARSVSKKTGTPDPKILSKPNLPTFPVIQELEGCRMVYKPSEPPRENASDWRKMFWIPSFPGSGSSNPTQQGDLLKDIIGGLFHGEEEGGYKKSVKNFHVSVRGRLKRCIGVSETIACSSGHPLVSTSPETQTENYHPETILPIRNPATVIPISYAYRNIAYHKADKQAPEAKWRTMRDEYLDNSFQDWITLIKHWRGTANDSYYFTKLYVPFEDLVTIDATKGTATIKKISDLISGRDSKSAEDNGYFETATEEQDYKCLWYQTALEEWKREKTIIGDYIPAYTQAQKDKMVNNLRAFADEVESDSFHGEADEDLLSLLRRYAEQIEKYVRLEPQDLK